jgi:hypothetical protein
MKKIISALFVLVIVSLFAWHSFTASADTSLVGWWTLDSFSGSTTADSSGNGNTGTDSGSAVTATGQIGQAWAADGSSVITVPGLLGQPSSVTLSTWVNLPAAPANRADVLGMGASAFITLDCKVSGCGSDNTGVSGIFYKGSNNWVYTPSGVNIAGTGWHLVTFTIDNAAHLQTIYIDGVQKGQTTYTNAINYSDYGGNTTIGSTGDFSPFVGNADDVRIYNRALSASDVAALYADGSGTQAPDTVPPVIASHADVTAQAATSSGITVTYTTPTANDAHDGSVAVSCTPGSDTLFAVGTTSVNCSAQDAAGNVASSSFAVIVSPPQEGTTTSSGLTPPAEATQWGYTNPEFAVDFSKDTIGVVDVNNTKAPGYKFYLNNGWPDTGNSFWATSGVLQSSEISVQDGALVIATDHSHMSQGLNTATALPGNQYVGQAFKAGFVYEAVFAYDPSLATSGRDAWPSLWAESLPFETGLTDNFDEFDVFEGFPTGSSTTESDSNFWEWGPQPHGGTHTTAYQIPGVVPDNQYHTIDKVWVPPQYNNGVGLVQVYWDGVHIAADDVTYSSTTEATPGADGDIGNRVGLFTVGDNQEYSLIIGAGVNWPIRVKSLTLWGRPDSGSSTSTPPTAPTIAGHGSVSAQATGTFVTFTNPAATDANGNSLSTSCTPASNSFFLIGTTTVSCTAEDAGGNAATSTFNVVVGR